MYRWQWIPLIACALAFLATMGVLALWRRRTERATSEQPLGVDRRRGPCESLRAPISATNWDAAEYAALAVFLPPALFCLYPLKQVYAGALPELETLAAFLGAAALLQAWILVRLWRVLARSRALARGLEAEVAAGQELEELRHMGYYVFHDVPSATQGENLDHIVVGPAGVFAVSAKARSGRGANRHIDAWEVTYDGEKLLFPGWEETLPLGQAIAKADWLFEWLYDELGEPVPVRPILVLPGWSVKRTAVSGIPVLAAHRIQAYFARMRALPVMGEGMIERIAEHLDQRCRVLAVVSATGEKSVDEENGKSKLNSEPQGEQQQRNSRSPTGIPPRAEPEAAKAAEHEAPS